MTPGATLILLFRPGLTASIGPRRDGPVYRTLQALLESTGEFDIVTVSREAAAVMQPGSVQRWAHLQQGGARVQADANPNRDFRQVSYRLTIETRIPDDIDAYDESDRIEAAVRDALLARPNRNYAGYCIPRYSMLGSASYTYNYPTVRLTMDGSFAYTTDMGSAGYQSAS